MHGGSALASRTHLHSPLRCSHDMWYHERASVHFTIARSLGLKSEVSSKFWPILACACSAERLRSRRLRRCAPGCKHEIPVQLHTTEIVQQNHVMPATSTGQPVLSCAQGPRSAPTDGNALTSYVTSPLQLICRPVFSLQLIELAHRWSEREDNDIHISMSSLWQPQSTCWLR